MKLSIITINYNNVDGLRKTLASVAAQTYRDFEHIIVDGGSSDGSLEVIREYESILAYRLKWISEPDNGIYNAMNKGIEIALGKRLVNYFNRSECNEDQNENIKVVGCEYVLFLNSGDCLIDANVLQMVNDVKMQADLCYFDADFVYPNGKIEHHQYPDELSFDFFWQDALCHQATWYRINALVQMGGYDERYKIIGDTAMNMDLCLINNHTYQHYPLIISIFDASGISISKNGIELTQKEFENYYTERLTPALYQIFEKYRSVTRSAIYHKFEKLQCAFSKRIVVWFTRVILFFDRIFA